MKFLVDAQLPVKLKIWLVENGLDAIHAIDLPNKEFTTDKEIINFTLIEDRILISKDSDFYKQHLISGIPKSLVFITTGNISNRALIEIFRLNFGTIKNYIESGKLIIELSKNRITALR